MLLHQGGRRDTDRLASCVSENAGAGGDTGLCAYSIWRVCVSVCAPVIKWTHQDQMRQGGRHCPVKILSLILTDEPVSFKVSIIIKQLNCITVLTAYLNAHTPTQRREIIPVYFK